MNDMITWMWTIIIAIGLCSMILVPIFGLCYTFMKIKMTEIKERIDL
mgnify:CR=1 FL=1